MNDDIGLPETKALYIKSEDCLVLSDMHLGITYPDKPYPVMEHEELHETLVSTINDYDPSKIIFNGDVFSAEQADEYWIDMFNEFNELVGELVFNIGNHEEKNGGFPDFIRNNYSINNSVKLGEYLIHHGHRTPTVKSEVNIIGHLHPTVNGEDVLLEKKNAYYTTDVIVTPTFSNIVSGVDIQNETPRGHCPIIDDGVKLHTYNVVKNYE